MREAVGQMTLSPAVLAGRVFRIAAVGILAVIFGAVAAFVVAEEQCDAAGGGALCSKAKAATPPPPSVPVPTPAPSVTGLADISVTKAAADVESGVSDRAETEAPPEHVATNSSAEGPHPVTLAEVGPLRLGFAMCMLLSILAWLLATLKFALDGSLPARLALWGLLPEAYAAISVRAVKALLRLKTHGPTPVIVLRNCVTDKSSLELAEAMRLYGKQADLQAVELPHNPQMGIAGLKAVVEAAMEPESNVADLDFSYNPQLGDEAINILRPTLELKKSKISVLRLADCSLTSVGVKKIAEIAPRSKLRTLDLSWNSMQGAGQVLADIMEAPILEELVLACCDLGVKEMIPIAEQLPYTSLSILQVGGNRFGSKGLEVLSEHLPQSQVDDLGLEGTGIEAGCNGLNALAAAWVKRRFSRVRLHGNRMTNEEVATFIKTLRTLG